MDNNIIDKFSIHSILNKTKDKLQKYIKYNNIDKQFNNNIDYCFDFINKQKNIIMIALQYQHINILKIGFGDGFAILLLLMINPTIKIKCIDKYNNIQIDTYYKQLKNDYGDRIELIYSDIGSITKYKEKFDIIYFDTCNINYTDITNSIQLIGKKSLFIIDNYDNNEIKIIWDKYISEFNLIEPSYNNELFESKHQSIKEYNLINIVAFYTCFFGSDTNCANIINQPSLYLNKTVNNKEIYYDSYYFTNNMNTYNKLENTNWKRVYINIPIKDNDIDNAMDSKLIKACPHLLNVLNKYKITCYYDSKININIYKTEKKIIELLISNYSLIIPIHPFLNTNSVWNEFNESLKQERYKLEKIKYENYIFKQMIYGLTDYTNNSNHYTTHFIIRKNNNIIKELNTLWYEHIKECGIECQISFYFIQQIYKNDICSMRPYECYSYITSNSH
jgi:hypothetical protein